MKFDELTPQQLNALVHEYVMQKRLDVPCTDGQIDEYMNAYWRCTCGWISDFYVGEPKSTSHNIPIPHYCETMSDAHLVIKRVEEQDMEELHTAFASYLGVTYATDEGFDTFQMSLERWANMTPHTICKAALQILNLLSREYVLVEVQP